MKGYHDTGITCEKAISLVRGDTIISALVAGDLYFPSSRVSSRKIVVETTLETYCTDTDDLTIVGNYSSISKMICSKNGSVTEHMYITKNKRNSAMRLPPRLLAQTVIAEKVK